MHKPPMNSRQLSQYNRCTLAFLLGLLLSCIACGGATKTAESGDKPKVHALLIILGTDVIIRESVEKSQETMTGLMRKVSHSCEVHLTVMKSNPGLEGEVI